MGEGETMLREALRRLEELERRMLELEAKVAQAQQTAMLISRGDG